MYFKQCHTVEIVCGILISDTFFTEIPSRVDVTYFITLYAIMTLEYILLVLIYVFHFLFILKVRSHIIINSLV